MEKQEKFPEGEAPLKNTDNAFVRVEKSGPHPQEAPSSGPVGGTGPKEGEGEEEG